MEIYCYPNIGRGLGDGLIYANNLLRIGEKYNINIFFPSSFLSQRTGLLDIKDFLGLNWLTFNEASFKKKGVSVNEVGLVDLLKNGNIKTSPIILKDLLDYHTIPNFLGKQKESIILKNLIKKVKLLKNLKF